MTKKQFDKKILQILEKIENLIGKNLNDALHRIGILMRNNFSNTNSTNPWARNAVLKKQIENILSESMGKIVTLTQNQIKAFWRAAEEYNDVLTTGFLLKGAGITITAAKLYRYFNRSVPKNIDPKSKIKITKTSLNIVAKSPRNEEALQAFLKRKINGMSLSEKVWRIFDEGVMPQIESHLAQGIANGTSANKLAKDLKPYLHKPDKLFRRVRDKSSGKLKLSVQAQAYTPGRGVYRSSFMNAKRLAVSEINLAYRTADYNRWKKMDFVYGINVRRSNSAKGQCDLCDSLAGKYPKKFQFTGWHPFCICVATPILQNKDEFINSLVSGNKVQHKEIPIPGGLKKWVKKNSEKLKTSKSKPYFIKYNSKIIDELKK